MRTFFILCFIFSFPAMAHATPCSKNTEDGSTPLLGSHKAKSCAIEDL